MNEYIDFLGMPVYSKKNSKVMANKVLLSSERVREYEKVMLPVFLKNKRKFKEQYDKTEKPVKLEIYFIRPTKAKFDYINMAQLPLDMMQKAGLIEDDDCYHIRPIFTGWEVNKDKTKCGFSARIIN